MYLYNSATRKKEEFVPHTPGKVAMYTCGPTVYHFAHIGKGGELIEVSSDGFLLADDLIQTVDNDDFLSKAAGSDIFGQGHIRLLRFVMHLLPIRIGNADAEFSIFHLIPPIVIKKKVGFGLLPGFTADGDQPNAMLATP